MLTFMGQKMCPVMTPMTPMVWLGIENIFQLIQCKCQRSLSSMLDYIDEMTRRFADVSGNLKSLTKKLFVVTFVIHVGLIVNVIHLHRI